MRVCVVCRDALREVPRPNRKALIQDHEHYMLYLLPYFTQWMVAGRYQVDDDQLNRIA